jgi:hypothetical protein
VVAALFAAFVTAAAVARDSWQSLLGGDAAASPERPPKHRQGPQGAPRAVADLLVPAIDAKMTKEQLSFWIDVVKKQKQNMLRARSTRRS